MALWKKSKYNDVFIQILSDVAACRIAQNGNI